MGSPVLDALGRHVSVDERPRRIVSLVPSETESVAVLGGDEARARLVGRTDYCELPAWVSEVASVGGTKNVDVDRVVALEPDLVLANQEENSERDVRALIARGLRVHVSFPCDLASNAAYVATLARLLHVDVDLVPHERAAAEALSRTHGPVRVFVPIWCEPWMTFDERTFASALLAAAGAHNVFGGRPRRYPLAADLGAAEPRDPGARDTRYPRTTLDEVAARRPELVLLPDEPFRFDASHALLLAEALELPSERIVFADGKDLFWYGTRGPLAVARLRDVIASAAAR